MNIANWLERAAQRAPSKVAAIAEGKHGITYGEWDAAANRLGNWLQGFGIRPGERVAVLLANSLEFLIAYFGILKIGAVVVPVNIMYRAGEVKYVLNNAAPRVLIAGADYLQVVQDVWTDCPLLEHVVVVGGDSIPGTYSWQDLMREASPALTAVDRRPDDLANLYYTSGTTGRPKGVMISHLNITRGIEFETEAWQVTADDHTLFTLPMFHNYAMIIPSLLAIHAGGTLTFFALWDTETVLRTISEGGITFFAGVPTMYVYIVRHPDIEKHNLKGLRVCVVGGAAIPVEVQKEFEQLSGVRCLDAYGCTGWVSSIHPMFGPAKHGTLGKSLGDIYPSMDTQMRIVDDEDRELPPGQVGEIVVRGPQIAQGFWKLPEITRRDYRGGWFHTGDLGREDEDGFFVLVDRKDDLIITSGYNVYPREVEEVLYTHPKVSEAAVVGVPDSVRVQTIKAYVVLKAGQVATVEDIIADCRSKIAAFKVPRVVEFVRELPKTATGKIMRRSLRE